MNMCCLIFKVNKNINNQKYIYIYFILYLSEMNCKGMEKEIEKREIGKKKRKSGKENRKEGRCHT